MSFGDGDLHVECARLRMRLETTEGEVDMLRRRLRGAEDQLFEERRRYNRVADFAREAWRDISDKGSDEFLLFGWYEREARALGLDGARWDGVVFRRVDNE